MGALHESPQLSPAQWEVMKVLSDHGQLAASDVFGRLPKRTAGPTRPSRRCCRGWWPKDSPTYDPRSATLISTWRGGSPSCKKLRARKCAVCSGRLISEASSPVLAQFIEEADLTDEEIKQLKRLFGRQARLSLALSGATNRDNARSAFSESCGSAGPVAASWQLVLAGLPGSSCNASPCGCLLRCVTRCGCCPW